LTTARTELENLRASQPAPFETVLAVQEGEHPADVPVHVRGSHLNLEAEPTTRGFLSLAQDVLPTPPVPGDASGRLQLARWMCDPEHPLTARVMVNRLWQAHFGVGLVRSSSNFGLRGDTPSHPQLLDWLARGFVRDGWSVKAVHRRILTSATWCMSTRADGQAASAEQRDPENRLLWRQNRRRLEAEPLRDALLAVAGHLDTQVGGSLLPTGNRAYVTNDQSGNQVSYSEPRRSIYLPVIRNAMYNFFSTFDYADASVPLAQRPVTTVASQALTLLNAPLVLDSSARFARRVLAPGGEDAIVLERAWRLAFARPPTPAEREDCLHWLERRRRPGPSTSLETATPAATSEAARAPAPSADHVAAEDSGTRLTRWTRLCQVLLASNEFLVLD
jgi:hypothetical protein